jgi:hypothetical protein
MERSSWEHLADLISGYDTDTDAINREKSLSMRLSLLSELNTWNGQNHVCIVVTGQDRLKRIKISHSNKGPQKVHTETESMVPDVEIE